MGRIISADAQTFSQCWLILQTVHLLLWKTKWCDVNSAFSTAVSPTMSQLAVKVTRGEEAWDNYLEILVVCATPFISSCPACPAFQKPQTKALVPGMSLPSAVSCSCVHLLCVELMMCSWSYSSTCYLCFLLVFAASLHFRCSGFVPSMFFVECAANVGQIVDEGSEGDRKSASGDVILSFSSRPLKKEVWQWSDPGVICLCRGKDITTIWNKIMYFCTVSVYKSSIFSTALFFLHQFAVSGCQCIAPDVFSFILCV